MCPHTHAHKCVLCFPKPLYLGVEEHIRDEVSLNRVANDCFIEVVGRWLSHEDGTVWFCGVNKIVHVFLTNANRQQSSPAQTGADEGLFSCAYVIVNILIYIHCPLNSKFPVHPNCVVPLLLHPLLSLLERYHYTKRHIPVSN